MLVVPSGTSKVGTGVGTPSMIERSPGEIAKVGFTWGLLVGVTEGVTNGGVGVWVVSLGFEAILTLLFGVLVNVGAGVLVNGSGPLRVFGATSGSTGSVATLTTWVVAPGDDDATGGWRKIRRTKTADKARIIIVTIVMLNRTTILRDLSFTTSPTSLTIYLCAYPVIDSCN